MSIADILIYTIDWIFQNALLQILPTNAAGLGYDTLLNYLSSFETTITGALSGFGFIAPIGLIFALVVVVLTAEFSLFAFHTILYIIKLVRG
jgi:hypothetical protein